MGLGRFGGGVGVVRFLRAQGKQVLLTDLEPADRLAESLAKIDDLVQAKQVTLRLGGHDERDFVDTDLVVANPAVPKPWQNPFLLAAEHAGVPITTEIRLLVERLPRRNHVIGVTGTAGKSTTSAMIAHALRVLIAEAGTSHKVFLGGNIGGSLLNDLPSITADDLVVLELSSAQLYWLASREPAAAWTPSIAVITNIAPNHLDWHGTFDHYAACKRAIFHDAEIRVEGHVDSLPPMNLRIPGLHNRSNAQLAIEVAVALGYARTAAAFALESFPGLPHRLQLVHEIDRIRAYNDSKCTTPEATALAIAAFDEPKRIRLICGGYDKKIDLAPMISPASACACVYTIGATGPTIDSLVRKAGGNSASCETLEVAVQCACDDAKPGDVILLSPGCASWGQFTNYEERGERFGRQVYLELTKRVMAR